MVDFYQARLGEASISITAMEPTNGAPRFRRNDIQSSRRLRLIAWPLGDPRASGWFYYDAHSETKACEHVYERIRAE